MKLSAARKMDWWVGGWVLSCLLTACGPVPVAGESSIVDEAAAKMPDETPAPVDATSPHDEALDEPGAGELPPVHEAEVPPQIRAKPAAHFVTRYPVGATHSPLSPSVVTHLRAIAGNAGAPRFSKVGDSITASANFLFCFAGDDIDYGAHPEWSSTVSFFANSFARTSLSAKGGWAAFNVLGLTPSRLAREIAAFTPQFAVIMLGTNDSAYDRAAYDFFRYGSDMFRIVDTLTNAGVVPLLSSIPPRTNRPEAAARVPAYNAFLRALAEARQIPFVDYHLRMQQLPNLGLSSDGVHPSVRPGHPCDLSDAAVQYGYNLRNALVLEALHRVTQVVVGQRAAPDDAGTPREGDGTAANPVRIDSLPFGDLRDTRSPPADDVDRYPSCDSGQDESGGEVQYTLTLTEPTTITAYVFDPGSTDIDIHLLSEDGTCQARAHQTLTRELLPGTHRFSLDTFVSSTAGELAGEYLFLVVEADD